MYDYEMEESESRDRLSELPYSLILHILSFLPMRHVVRTNLLSKRWKNLWTAVPCLNFIDYIEEDPSIIRNFVNRALMFWKGTKILKFKIDFSGHFDMSLASDVDLWVRFATEHEVEELFVHLTHEKQAACWDDDAVRNSKKDVYWAPRCLSSCSSIKDLSLVACNFRTYGSPPWNQLKSLRIDGFCFSERVINRVLSGAPQLEVFVLRLLESYENLNIRSRSLKKLKIQKYLYFHDDDRPSTATVLRISCPNLQALEISGVLYCRCLLTNVSSLTDINLGFCGSCYYDNGGFPGKALLGQTLRQIFPSIRHVEKVTLSNWCVQVLGAMEKRYLPSPLWNVKFLQLNFSSIELDEMVNLLEIFPNLKLLNIKQTGGTSKEVNSQTSHTISETNLPKFFLLQLRTVEIALYWCETSIFPCIEFLLKHARLLEKMVVRARGIMSRPPEYLFLAAEKLLSMPRSSPTAKVIFCKN